MPWNSSSRAGPTRPDRGANLSEVRFGSAFSFEVTRSLAASKGAMLIVDASHGVDAQTLANGYKQTPFVWADEHS